MFVAALMAVVVLTILGMGALSISMTEDVNARRERMAVLAFYAAEAGVHEALVRMNLNPSGAGNDETEVAYSAPAPPDSVRDPRLVTGSPPDPNPANYSDPTTATWRFWNYDPAWRYSGSSTGGEGNYPGATAAQQANLGGAGRGFAYSATSPRALVAGSGYTVRVAPLVRNFAGVWMYCDERGNPAPGNYFYYTIAASGGHGPQGATVQVAARKFFFGMTVPAALTAGGDVHVTGNATVTAGDPGDRNAGGIAIQADGTITVEGSASVPDGRASNTRFPGFTTIFGASPAEIKAMATITREYTTLTPSPIGGSNALNRTVGSIIWLSASSGGVKGTITMDSHLTLGSPEQPVVLVVDGHLDLKSVTIYGVVYVTGGFMNQGSSQITGATLAEGTATTDISGTGGEGTKIAYSTQVIQNLNRSQNMFPFRSLRGTWKMSRG